jgi:hypothetical protein
MRKSLQIGNALLLFMEAASKFSWAEQDVFSGAQRFHGSKSTHFLIQPINPIVDVLHDEFSKLTIIVITNYFGFG